MLRLRNMTDLGAFTHTYWTEQVGQMNVYYRRNISNGVVQYWNGAEWCFVTAQSFMASNRQLAA